LKERGRLEDSGIAGWILLKLFLRKRGRRMRIWTGFFRLG
jgi:hypothetical protein